MLVSKRYANPPHITFFSFIIKKSPYSIDARQLHADVDDHNTEDLPTDCVIQQQVPHWQRRHWW